MADEIRKCILNNLFVVILTIIFLSLNFYFNSLASWYEEPVVLEKQEDIDKMWWLSKKKKEQFKKNQEEELKKFEEENKTTNHIKWLYDGDPTRFPKDKWEVIDENKTGIGYNYYFDKDGYLLMDTITPDFKIVDKKGREVDNNLRPIAYDMTLYLPPDETHDGKILDTPDNYIVSQKEPAKVIIGEGVVLKDKQKIYDNSIDKNLLSYVDNSNKFNKNTKATIYNELKWKSCSSLKGNDAYVIFNNPSNNFNKVTGKIASEYYTTGDELVEFTLYVYDADIYDDYDLNHHLYDIEEIYTIDNFNNKEPEVFTFTFDRSVKRLRFEITTNTEKTSRKVYFKDLKYGFNKTKFKEELERKKEDEEEIEYLKKLGIWVEDYSSFIPLDEDGNEIEEDDEEEEHENENLDDEIGGISYEDTDETESYEDKARDRTTGPAFDTSLKDGHTWRDSGPAFIEEAGESISKKEFEDRYKNTGFTEHE